MLKTVRPGAVDWTGDNPFIYLKEDAFASEWSSLSLYFRIALSPHGHGRAIVVLEQPYVVDAPNATRLCVTDNAPLARYLLGHFVKKFGLFRPCAALIDALPIVDGARFETRVDGSDSHSELATHAGHGVSASMTWQGLGAAFAVDVPPDLTQTGIHEMFSVFQPARTAFVTVNGARLAGQTVERDFFGGRAQSAALAHSETWVKA
jgi:hypothetical protein